MITFYYGSGSPYGWRVWLALEHKRIPYDLKIMSFSSGDLTRPEYLAINPRHKVPAITDEGFALYESAAIVEYLDEAYPTGPSLFPGSIQRRAVVGRMVQETDQYYAVARERIVDQGLFTPQDKWDLDEIAAARARLAEELQRWESFATGAYPAGESVSAADFALYPLLALTRRMEKKKPDLDVAGMAGPKVSAWMQRIEALPYFQKTWPPHWK